MGAFCRTRFYIPQHVRVLLNINSLRRHIFLARRQFRNKRPYRSYGIWSLSRRASGRATLFSGEVGELLCFRAIGVSGVAPEALTTHSG